MVTDSRRMVASASVVVLILLAGQWLVVRLAVNSAPDHNLIAATVKRLDEIASSLESKSDADHELLVASGRGLDRLGDCPSICLCSRIAPGVGWALAFAAKAQPLCALSP